MKITGQQLINEYKERFSASDKQIAEFLGASRAVVTEAKNNSQVLKFKYKFLLADQLGYPCNRELILSLLED